MKRRKILRSYDDLILALQDKRVEMGMTCMELEERSGLHNGYISKLENCFSHNRAGSARFIGPVSLTLWLQALEVGLEIVSYADQQNCAGKHHSGKQEGPDPAKVAGGIKRQASMSPSERTKLARRGVKLRKAKLSAAIKSEVASNAAKARWAKHKIKQLESQSAQ